MKEYRIAVMEGDGIGPEIIREGLKVLSTAADTAGIALKYQKYPYGTEHLLKTGEVLPEHALQEFRDQHAIYFGAAGDPRVAPGVLEVGLILRIRFELDQYVNLRPVKLYPNVESPVKLKTGKVDFYVVRENLEDFYNGMGAILRTNGDPRQKHHFELAVSRSQYKAEVSVDFALGAADTAGVNLGIITSAGAERVIRYAFELARAKGKKKVSSLDKANVIPQMYGVWREAFTKVAADYPGMEHEFLFADAATMWFVKQPEEFGVVVAPNLFGDILSDLGAGIAGGLGFAAGANINPNGVSMFEPIHGSAPKYAGKNVINPIATILSGGLLLDAIGEPVLGKLVDEAVTEVLREGKVRTRDMGGSAGTSDMGDAVAAMVKCKAR